jgi:3-hydroxyacyl-[acyl-carrier-protein] dehydratase
MIEINEILTLLPHAFPFLLVDRILDYEPEKRIVGVLIIEAMAQTAGILAFKSYPAIRGNVLFIGIDNARFRKPVIPGDQLRLVLEVVKHRREIWVFDGEAFVDDKKVAEARIMATLQSEEER